MAALQLIKQVKGAKLFIDPTSKVKCILLENVRASYSYIGTPGEDEDDNGNKKKAWRTNALIPKSTHEEANKLMRELIKELMTANDVKIESANWFLSDGDGEKYEDEKHKAVHGHWIVSCKDATHAPTVRDEKGRRIERDEAGIAKIDEMMYSGCWMNLMIRPWYYSGKSKGSNKTFPKRILAGFQSCQKHHNDTPFGTGRIDDDEAYGAIEGHGDGMEETVDVDDL